MTALRPGQSPPPVSTPIRTNTSVPNPWCSPTWTARRQVAGTSSTGDFRPWCRFGAAPFVDRVKDGNRPSRQKERITMKQYLLAVHTDFDAAPPPSEEIDQRVNA